MCVTLSRSIVTLMSVSAAAPTIERAPRGTEWGVLAIPGLIWGASFFFIAEGLESFAPPVVTSLRVLFGFATLALIPQARATVPLAAWPRIIVLGLVWMAIPLTLFPFAEEHVSSSLTGMLNGAVPLFATTVAALIARRIPLPAQLVGLGIGSLGIVFMAVPSLGSESSSGIGIVLILIALMCYGVGINIAAPLQREYGSLPVIMRVLVVALVATAPLGIGGIGDSSFGWTSFAALVALGAGGTGLAYALMAFNAGRFGGARASTTVYLTPVIALGLGVVFRGEDVAVLAIVGSGMALVGAFFVNTAPKMGSRSR